MVANRVHKAVANLSQVTGTCIGSRRGVVLPSGQVRHIGARAVMAVGLAVLGVGPPLVARQCAWIGGCHQALAAVAVGGGQLHTPAQCCRLDVDRHIAATQPRHATGHRATVER